MKTCISAHPFGNRQKEVGASIIFLMKWRLWMSCQAVHAELHLFFCSFSISPDLVSGAMACDVKTWGLQMIFYFTLLCSDIHLKHFSHCSKGLKNINFTIKSNNGDYIQKIWYWKITLYTKIALTVLIAFDICRNNIIENQIEGKTLTVWRSLRETSQTRFHLLKCWTCLLSHPEQKVCVSYKRWSSVYRTWHQRNAECVVKNHNTLIPLTTLWIRVLQLFFSWFLCFVCLVGETGIKWMLLMWKVSGHEGEPRPDSAGHRKCCQVDHSFISWSHKSRIVQPYRNSVAK